MSTQINRAAALVAGLAIAVAPLAANAHDGPGGDHGNHGHGHPGFGHGPYRRGGGPHGHMWHRGDRYNGGGVYVDNWRGYHGLYAPPQGYRWINYGGTFLLAAIAGGVISNVIANGVYAAPAYPPGPAAPYPPPPPPPGY